MIGFLVSHSPRTFALIVYCTFPHSRGPSKDMLFGLTAPCWPGVGVPLPGVLGRHQRAPFSSLERKCLLRANNLITLQKKFPELKMCSLVEKECQLVRSYVLHPAFLGQILYHLSHQGSLYRKYEVEFRQMTSNCHYLMKTNHLLGSGVCLFIEGCLNPEHSS